jgi:AbrB family looped-hinge helix DNA binding protein
MLPADQPNLPYINYNGRVESYTTHLEKSGRILIPAAVRRQLGLSEGSPVLVKVEESGALKVTSRSQALAKFRKRIRKHIPAGQDLAEQLIRDRRAEVKRDDEKASRP